MKCETENAAALQTVISNDGTRIHYHTIGAGRPLIVIPGVMSIAADYRELALALAGSFTVHTVERRGRGRSGPQGNAYCIAKECQDVIALQRKVGAAWILGHSFGGLIALEAARNKPFLEKVAVYEPGVSVNGSIPATWTGQYQRDLDAGKYLDAFAGFSIALGPDRARKTPRWLMKLILRSFVNRYSPDQFVSLLRANLREHLEVAKLDNSYENYRQVSTKVLIMAGGRSGLPWVAPAIRELSAALALSEVKTFDLLDHFGPVRGNPSEVAQAARRFFLGF